MSKKRVLITGCSGQLGSAIRAVIDRTKYDVYGIDLNRPTDGDEMMNFYRVDLTNSQEVDMFFRMVPEMDIIIHLAATILGVAGFNNADFMIMADDITMTKNLLENAGGKFIFLSSSMVYERNTTALSKEPDTENTPPPLTGYGMSKLVGEQMVKHWGNTYSYGQKWTIWRPFNIITPWEESQISVQNGQIHFQGWSHVFADFMHKLLVLKQNPLEIIGDGTQIRCFTWYEEVAECIVDNLENPDTENEIFNIGNDEPVAMANLAGVIYDEAVARGHLPDVPLDLKSILDIPRDVKHRRPDVSKARNLLGFEARVKLKESIGYLMDEWEKVINEEAISDNR